MTFLERTNKKLEEAISLEQDNNNLIIQKVGQIRDQLIAEYEMKDMFNQY